MNDAESRLRHFARQVAQHRQSPAAPQSCLDAIKQFQRDRLARSHADLLQSERYRLAARFFLDELYGVKDFGSRDAELAKMIPSMSRVMPAAALGAIADAVELDAVSEQLDDAMAALLAASPHAPGAGAANQTAAADETAAADDSSGKAGPLLREESYFELYRATGRRELRERQIALIEDVGRELDRLVRKPFLYRILKGMEGPARLAGLGQMQAFLVKGFEAFRAMQGAEDFVQTIASRERALMEQAFAGDLDAGAPGTEK